MVLPPAGRGPERRERFLGRLAYAWDWEKEENRVGETLVTVEFEVRGDATEVVLLHSGFPAVEVKESHEHGWGAGVGHFEELFS